MVDAFPARDRRVVDVRYWVALKNVNEEDGGEKAGYYGEGAPDEVFLLPVSVNRVGAGITRSRVLPTMGAV